MNAGVFVMALVAGAGALALWVDVRFPRLAPRELNGRMVAAVVAFALVAAAPISSAGGIATAVTLLGVLLPALCFALLAGLWLMRGLSDART